MKTNVVVAVLVLVPGRERGERSREEEKERGERRREGDKERVREKERGRGREGDKEIRRYTAIKLHLWFIKLSK